MIELSLELKKNILNKLNENNNHSMSVESWFTKETLSEFGNYNICKIDELTLEDETGFQYEGAVYRVLLNDKETDMTFLSTWQLEEYSFTFLTIFKEDIGKTYLIYHDLDLCEKYEKTIVDWKVIECE